MRVFHNYINSKQIYKNQSILKFKKKIMRVIYNFVNSINFIKLCELYKGQSIKKVIYLFLNLSCIVLLGNIFIHIRYIICGIFHVIFESWENLIKLCFLCLDMDHKYCFSELK